MTFVEPRSSRSRTLAVLAGVVTIALSVVTGIPPAGAEGTPITLSRLAAGDRFATAATIATSTFTTAGTVFIARGDDPDGFADALAANYPAGLVGAPVLLTNPTEVPEATLDALAALQAQSVTILGGTGAISPGVEQTLAGRGLTVARLAGEDRFATAANIAQAPGAGAVGHDEAGLRTAVLSSGRSFPDALAAGGLVWARHLPQLLTEPTTLPDATAGALTSLGIQRVLITGGTGVISTGVEAQVRDLGIDVERIAGDTRYDTAVALADESITAFGFSPVHVEIATGESFPDALAGGGHAGRAAAATILTPRTTAGPAACSFLQDHLTLVSGHVLGGTAAVGDAVLAALAARCGGAPTAASLTVSGHGWGHGRGLGQFGAFGYAKDEGWSSEQILQHFYSNTGEGHRGGATIRVRLVAWDAQVPKVTSAQAFTVGGLVLPARSTAWVTNDAGVWNVHVADPPADPAADSCAAPETSVTPATAAPVFSSNVPDPGDDLTKMLAVCDGASPGVTRSYRGGFEAVLDDDGVLRFVNIVGLEAYLRGVVPRESPASWPAAALEAQAVAARSYAAAEHRYPYADTCDTTSCQVYRGAGEGTDRIESDRTNAAITATAGEVRMLNGAVARTEFSSSTGGYTAGGTFPAVPDEGDDVASNPNHDWTEDLDMGAMADRYDVGTIQSVEVIERTTADEGRRVARLRITGTTDSVERSGEQFRADWGLKSTWYSITVPPP